MVFLKSLVLRKSDTSVISYSSKPHVYSHVVPKSVKDNHHRNDVINVDNQTGATRTTTKTEFYARNLSIIINQSDSGDITKESVTNFATTKVNSTIFEAVKRGKVANKNRTSDEKRERLKSIHLSMPSAHAQDTDSSRGIGEEHKDENTKILSKLDDVEQNMKENQLRVYGVPENTANVNEHLKGIFDTKLELKNIHIEYSYRIGKSSNETIKPRPVLVKFGNTFDRNQVFFNKKKFKNSSISVTEELTKKRYELLIFTKGKLGKEKVWTVGGKSIQETFNCNNFHLNRRYGGNTEQFCLEVAVVDTLKSSSLIDLEDSDEDEFETNGSVLNDEFQLHSKLQLKKPRTQGKQKDNSSEKTVIVDEHPAASPPPNLREVPPSWIVAALAAAALAGVVLGLASCLLLRPLCPTERQDVPGTPHNDPVSSNFDSSAVTPKKILITPENWLINLNTTTIPPSSKELLALEPSFALPYNTKDFPMFQLIKDTEYCIQNLPEDTDKDCIRPILLVIITTA
ncbi:unnamed protein product [Ceutorhynchus assimilis]|uniref:Uncharacterized protein n=1 Tax=Ceutorhynchus assimilis TaxID=467358 RepID=A0A9N9QQH9_9CUCU|nr:unnamed protein product [Ceutorhynchus assimilis]